MNKKPESEDIYYKKIKKLLIKHFSDEVPYYSSADLRPIEKTLLKKMKPKSFLLDVGCNAGRFSIPAAKNGFKVIGIDITKKTLDAAKIRAKKEKFKNVKFMEGDFTNLKFKSNFFDYAICPRFTFNAVATEKYRLKALKEMLRVVKKDGFVFIESFNKYYMGNGPVQPVKNVLRDFYRNVKIAFCNLANKKYNDFLPGDIIYENNKIIGLTVGFTHIPSIFELEKLAKKVGCKAKFLSIPEVKSGRKDLFKYFRYSICMFIDKHK
jgi:ubiquinone/menaquinone biosynthesis C-methylase UbiE